MADVFICYRREDSSGHAGRLFDRFDDEFGTGHVFMDIVGMEPGVNFKLHIEQAIHAASVVVVLIGTDWLDAANGRGDRRLDDPRDFVRIELETALGADKPVVPLLVRAARMPNPDDLPETLTELAYLNAVELSDSRWDYDVAQLVAGIRRRLKLDAVPSTGAPPFAHTAPESPPARVALEAEARRRLGAGVHVVAEAMRPTLGSNGDFVVIRTETGRQRTRNGLAIVRALSLTDAVEQEAVELVEELGLDLVATGGGLTIAAVLADVLVTDGIEAEQRGHSRPRLVRGARAAVDRAVRALREAAIEVSTKEQVARVAAVSSGDEEIGRVIAEAVETIGSKGVVQVQGGQSFGMGLQFTEGMQFDRGYISPLMVTDQDRLEASIEDPYILIATHTIGPVRVALPILEQVIQTGHPLLIIADDVEGEALATLVVNKQRGTFTSIAVKAPGLGGARKGMLEDIAILTGGEVITGEGALKLENAQVAQLGRARRVVVTKETTTIVDGDGDTDVIKARVEQLRAQLAGTASYVDRQNLEERLAKLAGGVAVVIVGGATEREIRERVGRCEIAARAVRVALQEGIVPGGGTALVAAASTIELPADPDERAGATLVVRALEQPLRTVARNAGLTDDGISEILDAVRQSDRPRAFDAMTGQLLRPEDPTAPIDPVAMLRRVVLGAAALAERVLTTQGVLVTSGSDAASPD